MTDSEQLREKDRVVLDCIEEGHDDVQKITAATTLENHHVTYAFEKLEDLDLITVEKPDGMVERVIDGQRRVFQAPKRADLTDDGRELLEREETDRDGYENLSHRELIERVHELETRVESLEQQLDVFREQVQQRLDEPSEKLL